MTAAVESPQSPTSPSHELAQQHLDAFLQSGESDEIKQAIFAAQSGLRSTADEHPNKAKYYALLGKCFATRARLSKGERNEDDTDSAVEMLQKSVHLSRADEKFISYSMLARALRARYDERHDAKDLDEEVMAGKSAIDSLPDAYEKRPLYLAAYARSLFERFKHNFEPDDIADAISNQLSAIDALDDDNAKLPYYRLTLGSYYLARFDALCDPEDISLAIDSFRKALLNISESHPLYISIKSELGSALRKRYEASDEKDDDDLEQSIEFLQLVVDSTPADSPSKAMRLSNLSSAYNCRFQQSGKQVDIDKAVDLARSATQLTPRRPTDKTVFSQNHGNTLHIRFDYLNVLDDMMSSIDILRAAVDDVQDSEEGADCIHDLNSSLLCLYNHRGEETDLDEAIRRWDEAVKLAPKSARVRVKLLSGLAIARMCRYIRRFETRDIDESVKAARSALSSLSFLRSNKRNERIHILSILGAACYCRFEQLLEKHDIDDAIKSLTEAVDLTPDKKPIKVKYLNTLGKAHRSRFELAKDETDLNYAIDYLRFAIKLTRPDDPAKHKLLDSLGDTLQVRSQVHKSVEDLDEAITFHEDAVSRTPVGHSQRPFHLSSWGNAYHLKFVLTGKREDIDTAIEKKRESVSLMPDDHAQKAALHFNLAASLRRLAEVTDDEDDFQEAVKSYTNAAASESGLPSIRIRGANEAAAICTAHPNLGSPIELHRAAIELIPKAVWLGAKIHRRYEDLPNIARMVHEAVAAAISGKELDTAVEWLEEGRCVVWGQMLLLRTPLDALRAVNAELADELQKVSAELEIAASGDSSLSAAKALTSHQEDEHTLEQDGLIHRELARRYEELVEQVRKIEDFKDFLRPTRIHKLLEAIEDSPVVILHIDKRRCDAVIVRRSGVSVVPLKQFAYDRALKTHKAFIESLCTAGLVTRGTVKGATVAQRRKVPKVLADLWSYVVQPVLAELGYTAGGDSKNLPRITWCPTGEFAFLPIHAAGRYDRNERLFKCAVSSYTPSITALIQARESRNSQSLSGTKPQLIAISQPATPGFSPLANTINEVEQLVKLFPTKDDTTWLNDTAGDRASVLAQLKDTKPWVHFACHGVQSAAEPTDSAFCLHDGPLTLGDLMRARLTGKQLAVLSACETAMGHSGLPEEAVHLAAGMMLAGFPRVVATLWSIQDEIAPRVMKELYDGLLNAAPGGGGDLRAAHALHVSLEKLREKIGENAFLSWVPFVHYGL